MSGGVHNHTHSNQEKQGVKGIPFCVKGETLFPNRFMAYEPHQQARLSTLSKLILTNASSQATPGKRAA